MTETKTPTETHTLEVPGAVLAYDVRAAETETTEPPLLLIGSPLDASGFRALSEYFRDRTVVTYDPRGVARSKRTDGARQANPDEHADDLHRVIAALDAGPVEILGSSGGATNGLILVGRHPEQVRTLVAHEPPLASVLPDREEALAAAVSVHETYEREGFGPAMAKFMVLASTTGPIPADFPGQRVDPASFGLPSEDDGGRDEPLLGQNIIGGTHYELDFDAIRAASSRVVIAAGVESEGQFTYRAAHVVAERLGKVPVIFPSHHGGFHSADSGYPGEPEAFAAKLREVLGAG